MGIREVDEHLRNVDAVPDESANFEVWQKQYNLVRMSFSTIENEQKAGWNAACDFAIGVLLSAHCLGPSHCGGIHLHDARCPVSLAAKIRKGIAS